MQRCGRHGLKAPFRETSPRHNRSIVKNRFLALTAVRGST